MYRFLCPLADSCLGIHQSKEYGQGGPKFDDKSSWKYDDITAVRLECSNNYMHSIQMKYGDTWAKKHGADAPCSKFQCKTYEKELGNDERITNVKMIIGKTFISPTSIKLRSPQTNGS